jgi:hypothetical protein
MGSIAALPGIVAFPTFALGACRSFRMRQTNRSVADFGVNRT